eukprot:sb/3474088/
MRREGEEINYKITRHDEIILLDSRFDTITHAAALSLFRSLSLPVSAREIERERRTRIAPANSDYFQNMRLLARHCMRESVSKFPPPLPAKGSEGGRKFFWSSVEAVGERGIVIYHNNANKYTHTITLMVVKLTKGGSQHPNI